MFQLISTIVAILMIVADQFSKKWVVSTFVSGDITLIGNVVKYELSDITEIPIINNVLYFKFVPNTGVAFSMFNDSRWLLVGITALMIIICCAFYLSGRITDKLEMISLASIIAGGIGNLSDRIRLGYVIDFIDVRCINFAIFNVADICITVGAFLLCLSVLLEDRRKEKEKKEREKQLEDIDNELNMFFGDNTNE